MSRPYQQGSLVLSAFAFALSCTESTGQTSSSEGPASASANSTEPVTGTATSSTVTGPTTSSGSGNFVEMPDLPAPGAPCDPWQDSCPPGQKCKPVADGLGPWIEAGCVPIGDAPMPTGETCLEPEWSITDECERGAVCHGFLGPEGGRRCHQLCAGSIADPSCTDPCSWCSVNGIAGVCLFTCDPRAPQCPDGQSCQVLATAPRFVCALGQGSSAAGDSCVSSGHCIEGTACVDAAFVPNCAGNKCCAPVCDLNGPDDCGTALPGTTCATWPGGGDFEASCVPSGLGLCSAA